ncbi:hypothetical protein KSS87_011321 [Heliosperma pusillum]|nr:hypothetical protein KSS87_002737 [Heliosperma pusillum]KAH9625303.1 hypothetical protein KSS87_011321 [Heliosperma pusillum]
MSYQMLIHSFLETFIPGQCVRIHQTCAVLALDPNVQHFSMLFCYYNDVSDLDLGEGPGITEEKWWCCHGKCHNVGVLMTEKR